VSSVFVVPAVVLASEIVVSWVLVFSLVRNVELWMFGVARFRGNASAGSGVMLTGFHGVLNCPCKCVAYHG
jgi:hypothetical protein